jgi:3D (Asp-Asp-Asp) domain-containing protein
MVTWQHPRSSRARRARHQLISSAELWAGLLAVVLLPTWVVGQHGQQVGTWPVDFVAANMKVPDALAHENDAAVQPLQVSESWLATDDVWNAGERYARVTGTGVSGLRVRTGPGAAFPATVILREFAVVRIASSFVDDRRVRWVQIAGEDGTDVAGWSSAEFLTPLPPGDSGPTDPRSRSIVLGRIIPVKVTAYTYQVPSNGAHGWITKSGDLAAWGIVAVDPRIIPLGARLAIDGYSDLFLASDTGYGIIGPHIDIFFADHWRAVEFGVQQRDVIVYEPDRPV